MKTTTPIRSASRFRSTRSLAGYSVAALLLASTLPSVTQAQQGWSADEWLALPVGTKEIRNFEIQKIDGEITIDGRLDDEEWKNATLIDLPYEWFPGDNIRPPVRTDCFVTYSDGKLYIGFRAYDPEPEKLRAHLMDRDNIGSFVQDDHVGVNIDTFNDERQAIQFRVNPMGVQVDGTFDEFEGIEEFAWDAIWDSAAQVTAEGWEAEMAIPFRQLRFQRSDGPQTWGFEAFRNYVRTDRHRISSKYTDRNKECTLCQENKISGLIGLEPGRNLQVQPTLTGIIAEERENFPVGPLETAEEDAELGVNLRWGITPNLTLSGTYNPDFSQVEADTAQLNINERFALFFPEQRPFFLEGADNFETPLQVVFTRSLADPNFGVKLTGKEGAGTIGTYFVQDDINNVILPTNQGSRLATLPGEVENGVLRYRHDIGARSTVGVLYAGREGDDYHNRVAGVDAFIGFDQSNIMRVQYVSSDTRNPVGLPVDQDQDGDAFHVSYLHQTRNWFFNATYENLDEDFRADSGFIPRVDVESTTAQLQRAFWGTRETWYRRWTVGINAERVDDQTGFTTDEIYQAYVTLDGPRQSFGELAFSTRDEFFAGQVFELDRLQATFTMKPTGKVRLQLVVRDGENIDLFNAQEADERIIAPGLELRLGDHLNWRIDFRQQTLDVPGGELFNAELTQTRLVYQFNVRTFLRAIFQYQEVTRDPSLYAFPVNTKQEDLLAQLLFSYKINPQTVLFLGYTQNDVGTQNFSLTETDRTIFMKLGYAFLY
ncbi:MAG: DUF5916 domain-containing protein [Acidobacteriota bacterium]